MREEAGTKEKNGGGGWTDRHGAACHGKHGIALLCTAAAAAAHDFAVQSVLHPALYKCTEMPNWI